MKLAHLSRLMQVLSLLGMAVLPAVVVWSFLDPGNTQFLMLTLTHVGDGLSPAVPLQYRLDALFVELIPTACAVWALWSLARLFSSYAQGDVFGARPLGHLNTLALALFMTVILDIVSQLPISLLLSWHNGPHHREISLSFGSGDVSRLFIAGAVLVIARVMAEARRVADENAGFV